MDEYSPKRHDIAQLNFLCENLYDESMATLGDSHHGWVNDPTSATNIQLNELIEHIASFTMNYKIKHAEDEDLIVQIDDYLDDTFMLFSNYGLMFRIYNVGSVPPDVCLIFSQKSALSSLYSQAIHFKQPLILLRLNHDRKNYDQD